MCGSCEKGGKKRCLCTQMIRQCRNTDFQELRRSHGVQEKEKAAPGDHTGGGVMGFGFIQNGIFLAIVAHALIGASLIWDKVLLRRPGTRNLLSYVFWLGFISIFGLLLMPFGFHMPGLTV